MKKYPQKYLPLIIGTAVAAGIFMGTFFQRDNINASYSSNSKKEKLNRLIDYIDYEYVDKVNTDSIVDVTVNSILKDLDPHSTYIPESEYADVSRNMKGDFVGIGIQFYRLNDTIAVIKALENSPSEKAGIKAGDRILYADNIALFSQEITDDSLKNILQGRENTYVDLKVLRNNSKNLLDISVKRSHIPIKSVVASYMLNENLGYIKINRFAETTYEEFQKSAKALKSKNAKNIVLDLRDNGGGYLDQATQIADDFLNEDQLILFTKNKDDQIKKTFSTDDGLFENSKVYVLINENTASASEVIAGALQDNDVGTIIGRRSYGKGLVQREMDLGDGSAVRLTVARYYTPTGRSIQRPYENGDKSYFNEYEKRYKNGELQHKDSISVNDSLSYKTPKGKIVYGGGGIIPDIFVPKDLNYEKESLIYMLRIGVIDRFIFEELEHDRRYYNGLTLEDFNENFEVTDNIVVDFINYLKDAEVDFSFRNYKPLLKKYLKASIAEQLFGTNVKEKIINDDDKMIQKVLLLEEKNN